MKKLFLIIRIIYHYSSISFPLFSLTTVDFLSSQLNMLFFSYYYFTLFLKIFAFLLLSSNFTFQCIGCSFKFSLKVGVEDSIVNVPRITDYRSAV
jgi:hypothetical protein